MTDVSQVDTLFQFLALAKHNLSPGAWDYLMGGSETETTLNRNRCALDCLALAAATGTGEGRALK